MDLSDVELKEYGFHDNAQVLSLWLKELNLEGAFHEVLLYVL